MKKKSIAKKKKPSSQGSTRKANEDKWSKLLLDVGWSVIPNILLKSQRAVGLDPLDINIILHLITFWWESDNVPHPSKSTIAESIGVTPRTVQRRIAEMEKGGLIFREERRIKGQGSKTNLYRFDGLIKELKPYAKEMIKLRDQNKKKEKKLLSQKGKLATPNEDNE